MRCVGGRQAADAALQREEAELEERLHALRRQRSALEASTRRLRAVKLQQEQCMPHGDLVRILVPVKGAEIGWSVPCAPRPAVSLTRPGCACVIRM